MTRRKRYTRNLGRELKAPLPVRRGDGWVRFEHETEPYGVFWYLDDAAEVLDAGERAEMDELRVWFNKHLDAPDTATLERFWFYAHATEYINRARRLAELVSQAGFPIVKRSTRRVPGKVRWEDAHQVAVFTYRDTPRPGRKR